jgi:hypothetical protein
MALFLLDYTFTGVGTTVPGPGRGAVRILVADGIDAL